MTERTGEWGGDALRNEDPSKERHFLHHPRGGKKFLCPSLRGRLGKRSPPTPAAAHPAGSARGARWPSRPTGLAPPLGVGGG